MVFRQLAKFVGAKSVFFVELLMFGVKVCSFGT